MTIEDIEACCEEMIDKVHRRNVPIADAIAAPYVLIQERLATFSGPIDTFPLALLVESMEALASGDTQLADGLGMAHDITLELLTS